MNDPLLQGAAVIAPWGLILRLQDPDGVQYDNLIMAHNTEGIYRLARNERDRPTSPGWTVRQGFIVRDVIELPIHTYGFTTVIRSR